MSVPLSEAYLKTLVDEEEPKDVRSANGTSVITDGNPGATGSRQAFENSTNSDIQDNRANYIESPLRISEKRKVLPILDY
jgi:hypothetical protein